MATNKIVVQFPGPAARANQAGRLLIPSKLRDARKVARLSQGDLSDRIGVSRQAVSAYERGDKSPEPATFHKIADVLGQPVNFFMGLLPTEWVNLDVFLQVEADFKGFLVNLMVMSSQARCAHAKIRQEETSAG
jgi:transcriptional regulator with XRE-family HTH domain